jgi:hypothetical protein
VGRLENRVRKLEETVERGGFEAALARASTEDVFLLADFLPRVYDAQQAGEPIPTPTPEEAEAVQRFEELRAAAVREGWGEGRCRFV